MNTRNDRDCVRYQLYLDESGDFLATSDDATERAAAKNKGAVSQIAGVLATDHVLSRERAVEILRTAHHAIGRDYVGEFHCKDISSRSEVEGILKCVLTDLQANDIQPVRLVNKESVSYGSRLEIYVNLVAELLVRVFRRLEVRHPGRKISIEVHAAAVKLGDGPEGKPILIDSTEYGRRIKEYMTRIGVQRGFASSLALWEFSGEKVRMRSGKNDPEMQVCDCISHLSYKNFNRLGSETKQLFVNAFGKFDFTLIMRDFADRIEEFRSMGETGSALRELVMEAAKPKKHSTLDTVLEILVEDLCLLHSSWRNLHLSQLVSWLELTIEQDRRLDAGRTACEWILECLLPALAGRLEEFSNEIDWFEYALSRWMLAATNHQGDLTASERSYQRMERLVPVLAGRWEYAALLMGGMTVQSVHLSDRQDHEEASDKAGHVDAYYFNLSHLFADAYPIFPDEVRSDGRGKALGTRMQAEMLLGLFDPSHFRTAREYSEAAITEFAGASDRNRQYQYRCQLETYAGDHAAAKRFLARALRISETAGHGEIAERIGESGFGLLHWIRLGVGECLVSSSAGEEFKKAWEKVGRANAAKWLKAEHEDFARYPAHGILRQAAILSAHSGQADIAQRHLDTLRRIAIVKGTISILPLIYFAAVMSVAALLHQTHRPVGDSLLGQRQKMKGGLIDDIERYSAAIPDDGFSKLKTTVESMLEDVNAVLNGSATASRLSAAAARIGY